MESRRVRNVFGKRKQEKESLWVFSGDKLYRKSTVIETTSEVGIVPNSTPKLLAITHRDAQFARTFFNPSYSIYKIDGDRLVIATSRKSGAKPRAFVPTSPEDDSGVEDFVFTLKRIDKEAKIPEEMLKHFNGVALQHTKDPEVEAVVLKFLTALLKLEPLEVIEPLVAHGKAWQLLDGNVNAAAMDSEKRELLLKKCSVRDAVVGEKVNRKGSEPIVVERKHIGPNKMLVVLQFGGVDDRLFWLCKEGTRWKVDVTDLLLAKQSMKLGLVGGILLGMTKDRVKERLEEYKSSPKLESYAVINETKSELIVDWREEEEMVRHTFKFTDGKLSGYATKRLAK